MSTADEITKLAGLPKWGALREAKFQAAEARPCEHPAPPASVPTPPPSIPLVPRIKARKGHRARNAVIALAVLVALNIAIDPDSSGPSAKIVARVNSVMPLDGNTLRAFMTWKNRGKAPGSARCVLDTSVYNGLGDNVNVEVSSISTSGKVKPGQSQRLYQDIDVNRGDAPYETAKDVSITGCW